MSSSSRNLLVYHFDDCNRSNCSCPHLGSIRTIEAYRSSIKLLWTEKTCLQINPANSLECDNFILTLKKLRVGNRFTSKQANVISSSFLYSLIFSLMLHFDYERSPKSKYLLLRNVLVMVLLYECGARFSDVTRLVWSDVSLSSDALVITFSHTKYPNKNKTVRIGQDTSKPNVVELFYTFKTLIVRKRSINASDKLFLDWNSLINPKLLRVIQLTTFNSFLKSTLGSDISSHSLRVSQACETFSHSSDLLAVKHKLRLTTVSMAKHYCKQVREK